MSVFCSRVLPFIITEKTLLASEVFFGIVANMLAAIYRGRDFGIYSLIELISAPSLTELRRSLRLENQYENVGCENWPMLFLEKIERHVYSCKSRGDQHCLFCINRNCFVRYKRQFCKPLCKSRTDIMRSLAFSGYCRA